MKATTLVALAAVLLTLGCTEPLQESPSLPLRNPTAPVASQANVTPDRLTGAWTIVLGGGVPDGATLTFDAAAMQLGAETRALRFEGQGRFVWGTSRLWVHWMDADNRTAAIGDPGGAWFAIIDRAGLPRERLNAAREILDWYGYDVDRLTP